MIPFAVSVAGYSKPDEAQWVLAVSRESLLVAHRDNTLHWHKLADCKFARLIPPDAPQPVMLVEKQIVVPGRGPLRPGRDGRN